MPASHPITAPFPSPGAALPPLRAALPPLRKALSALLGALQALPFLASTVPAEFATPECPVFTEAEFSYSKLVTRSLDTTLNEPIKMAIDAREGAPADIYFVERHGNVKRYNGADMTVTLLAHIDVWSDSPEHVDSVGKEAETGLDAIVLDRDFRGNHKLYLRYEPWEKEVYRIASFIVDGDSLDRASEKILLEIPYVREHTRLHAIVLGGGGMAMDGSGNLYIAIGANCESSPSVDETYRDFSAEYTSSNLASLRGAILRIHPDESPRGYSIPKGNFGEYFSRRFAAEGRAALAAEYADPAKVKPEVYVKGVRNPYSLSVDPVKGWVLWGEFGPDRMGVTRIEEDNLAAHPVYAGYPYWSGKNEPLLDALPLYQGWDPKAPINKSVWNDGPRELPPTDTPRYAYSAHLNGGFIVGNHPTAGPIYHYDGGSKSSLKLPPHFDAAWFVTDRMNGVRAFRMSEDGTRLLDSTALMPAQKLERPLDLQMGGDGALYVLDYGTGWHGPSPQTHIGRIEYHGTCRPGSAGPLDGSGGLRRPGALRARIARLSVEVDEPGPHRIRFQDVYGRLIGEASGTGPMTHAIPIGHQRGVFFAIVETPRAMRSLAVTDF
jgi:cytochrome c